MARNKRIQKKIEVRKQTAANRAKQEPEAPQPEPLRVQNLPEDRVLDTETTPPSAQKDTQRASAEPDAESIGRSADEPASDRTVASACGPRAQAAYAVLKRLYQKVRPASVLLFFILMLAYDELVVKLVSYRSEATSFFFPLYYSVFYGAILALLCSFFSRRVNFIIAKVLSFAVFLFYGTQQVYFYIFKTYVTFYSVTVGTGQVMGNFAGQMFTAIFRNVPYLLLLLIPFLILCMYGKHMDFARKNWKRVLLRGGIAVVSFFAGLLLLLCFGKEPYTPYDLYYTQGPVDMTMNKLGIMTGMRLDVKRYIVGYENEPVGEIDQPDIPEILPPDDPEEPEPIDTSPNIMAIDFDRLIREEQDENIINLHKYFRSEIPSDKNEYTGMFKDYNLIMITAESFSYLAVDPELTPTLYKLVNSGFVFENFYNPIWGVSTLDGEYVACTGLYPKPGVWSFYRAGLNGNNMMFCMGNVLAGEGYVTKAYHDHTYDYYHRDVSHPNMGYDYKGVGNGLEIATTWPESDLEMMEVTVPEYINEPKFHVYYLTVSGHMNYNFEGNMMAQKNRDAVQHLDLSEPSKAYLACNIELDKAMENLLAQLEAAGKLDNTVIMLSPDHYPYGLEKQYIDELAGHVVEENFELYKSNLILWSGSMEQPVYVDKLCSSVDILPTLLNLFGVEYDSRLLMGRDILSTSPGMVLFSNASFMTEYGMYNSVTEEWMPASDAVVSDDYVESMKKVTNNKFKVSSKILDYDYYAHIK